MADDDFIGLPPGIVDSGTFRSPARTERVQSEKPPVIFVPTVPGMPVPPPAGSPTVDADADVSAATPAASEPTWTLTLLGGAAVSLVETTLLGRNPTGVSPWHDAALVPLNDPTQSVSKTHAALEVDSSGLWVHDLDSTNGVWVVVGDDATEVAPGRRVSVPPGATIELGEYALTVTRQ